MVNPFASVMILLVFSLFTENEEALPSGVYDWNKIKSERTATGERRQFIEAPTSIFESFKVHVTTLEPGLAPHGSHTHSDMEELVLVKEGYVTITINGKTTMLSPGSIAFAEIGDEHGIHNAGNTRATYYIIRWASSSPVDHERGKAGGGSVAIDYNTMAYKVTNKGGRRAVMQRPTSATDELEMHITTLNEGVKSHDQHTHGDEEIIVVLKGEVEEMIKDQPYRLGPGSLIYLAANDPHGIRNAGAGQCEYYAIRWKVNP